MNEDFRVDGTTLIKYSGEDAEVVVPEGITKIKESAFWGLENIKSVILPSTIETVQIGYGRLFRIVLRSGRRCILREGCCGGRELFAKMPQWSLDTIGRLTQSVADLIRKNWLPQMTPHYWAILYLTQNTPEFRELFGMHMADEPNEYLTEMIDLLKGRGDVQMLTNAAWYAAEYHTKLKKKLINELHSIVKSKEEAESARKILEMVAEPKEISKNSRYSRLYETFDEPKLLKLYRDFGGNADALDEVLSSDGKEYAPRIAVLAAVVPYLEFFDKERRSSYTSSKVKILKDSDEAAAMLRRASFIDFIKKNADIRERTRWLYPYCRFASEGEIEELIAHQKKSLSSRWNAFYAGAFLECVLPSNALMLSDSCAAKLELNEGKPYIRRIEQYAEIRGTSEDAVITDIGLDDNGRKHYDLGEAAVTAVLTDDFELKLEGQKDGTALSELQCGPGNKFKRIESDLKRKNEYLKEAVKIRTERLLRDFLSGKAWSFEEWKRINFATAVNKKLAEKIVYEQDGETFTVKDGMLINSEAEEFVPNDSRVKLAHPMEMNEADVCAWQDYFKKNGIKQTFVQIDEPVLNLHEIKEDRYMNAEIPLYKFMRSADGIVLNNPDNYTISLELKDCRAKCEFIRKPYWGNYEHIEVYKFAPEKYGRQANHIAALLDEWAAEEFIKKDDMSAAELLGGASYSKLEEFTEIAIENGANNMTAKLLEIKKERFPEYDGMDEFTLGDW